MTDSLSRFLIARLAPFTAFTTCLTLFVAMWAAPHIPATIRAATMRADLRETFTDQILLIDLSRNGLLMPLAHPPGSVSFYPGGRLAFITPEYDTFANSPGPDQTLIDLATGNSATVSFRSYPIFSPDYARFLVIARQQSDAFSPGVYLIDFATGQSTQVIAEPVDGIVEWTEDDRLTYTMQGARYQTGPDFSDPQPVESPAAERDDLTHFSPGRNWVIYNEIDADAGAYDLYLARADRSEPRLILADYPASQFVRWAPDACCFVYFDGDPDAPTPYLYDVATGQATPLTLPGDYPYPDGYRLESIVWSPDSQYLTISLDDAGRVPGISADLYLFDRSGQYLSYSDTWAYFPMWSPDGQFLLINYDGQDNGFAVVDMAALLANPDGDVLITPPGESTPFSILNNPIWTPDHQLIYIRYVEVSYSASTPLAVIYQYDPATRTGRNLMWEPLPFVSVADDAFTIND
jgi:Tol biopolymer transport system component